MEKIKNLVAGKKGFYGRVIRAFPHNIYVEEGGMFKYESYSRIFEFDNAFFVYQLDIGMDVRTHLEKSIDDAVKLAESWCNSIDKEIEDSKVQREEFGQEIEKTAKAVIKCYKKAEEQKIPLTFSYKKKALRNVKHVSIQCPIGNMEFFGGITLEKKENGKFEVCELDIYDRVGAIESSEEFDDVETAVAYAKKLTIRENASALNLQEIDRILKYRDLRNYGIVIEELPHNIFISIAPPNLVILYRVNEELDVIRTEAFTDRRMPRWIAKKWIKEIEANS